MNNNGQQLIEALLNYNIFINNKETDRLSYLLYSCTFKENTYYPTGCYHNNDIRHMTGYD